MRSSSADDRLQRINYRTNDYQWEGMTTNVFNRLSVQMKRSKENVSRE